MQSNAEERAESYAAEESNLAAGAPTPAACALRRAGADPYDAIVRRLRASQPSPEPGYAIGVVGCGRRTGATTVATNTAIRFADNSHGPVLLLECNVDRPHLARLFGLNQPTGLGEVVCAEADLYEGVHATSVEGLAIMPLGARGRLDGAGLAEDRFVSLLKELRGEFATIVMDLPPATRIASMLPLARRTDAALLVVRSEATLRRAAQHAVSRLSQEGVPVLGSIVTRRKQYLPHWYRSGV